MTIDYALIWAGLIAFAVLAYIVLLTRIHGQDYVRGFKVQILLQPMENNLDIEA